MVIRIPITLTQPLATSFSGSPKILSTVKERSKGT